MSITEDQIPMPEMGNRLRIAREQVGLTQADVATAIQISRTTLIAIEQGQRRCRINEVAALARVYNTSVNALLRREAVHVDFIPRFRKLPNGGDAIAKNAAAMLSNLVRAEVELETLLGVKRSTQYAPERPLLPGDIHSQAEANANELRDRLGLGNGPITNITGLLEMDLNVRVYVRRFDGAVSGLFAFDDSVGPCILLNANHPKSRRNQTAAHECGHFISTRREPEFLNESAVEVPREERYANAFGRALVTPARGVMKKFQEVTAGCDRLSRRHVIIMANHFGVSREAIVRRMEELKLAKNGTWNWFTENGGITDEQERQVLGGQAPSDSQQFEAEQPASFRLQTLAAEAFRRELLSESQLADLLGVDRVELRRMLDSVEFVDGTNGEEAPRLLV